MTKITFVNGQSGGTPLNATNMNQLQTNVENDIGNLTDLETSAKTDLVSAVNEIASTTKATILYNNVNGTTGSLALSENVTNYDEIDIQYYVIYANERVYNSSRRIPTAYTSRIHLDSQFISAGFVFQTYIKRIAISGTSLTVASDRYYTSSSSGSAEGNYVYITKIIGYKN